MQYQRKEIIGPHVLYLGNALDILPVVEPVDLICTDAPYRVQSGGNGQMARLRAGEERPISKPGFGGWMARGYDNGGAIVTCDIEWSDWLPLAFACLKNDRQAYFMTNGESEARARLAAEQAGFKFHTLLTWDKRSALPNRWYQNITEFTLFMRKGKSFTINDPSSKSLFSMFQRDVSEHPTEKPLELMCQYVGNSTDRGQTVLDPFMGSGTTGAAAARLGRRFIGVELEERWFDVACERVARADKEGCFFSNPLPMPIATQTDIFKGDAA